jgi:hypothetical protein
MTRWSRAKGHDAPRVRALRCGEPRSNRGCERVERPEPVREFSPQPLVIDRRMAMGDTVPHARGRAQLGREAVGGATSERPIAHVTGGLVEIMDELPAAP